MLDLTGRLVVIVGGGNVAMRKTIGLLAAGAGRVRVVSPKFHAQLPVGVERVVGEYEAGHLDGAALVFAATDNAQVNAAVVADARHRGIWVNRADSDDGDFSTPAVLREDAVTIAVATAGSPAIAATIRDQIKQTLDGRWGALAEAMKNLRPIILAAKLPEEVRRELFREFAGEEAAELARHGDIGELEARIRSRIKALGG
jgi:precorrin-2 dehydrogenase/sirohydrochlorin ferrochelatase